MYEIRLILTFGGSSYFQDVMPCEALRMGRMLLVQKH